MFDTVKMCVFLFVFKLCSKVYLFYKGKVCHPNIFRLNQFWRYTHSVNNISIVIVRHFHDHIWSFYWFTTPKNMILNIWHLGKMETVPAFYWLLNTISAKNDKYEEFCRTAGDLFYCILLHIISAVFWIFFLYYLSHECIT